MSKVYGEVIATPAGPTNFAAVFYHDADEINRQPVDTRAQGEKLIVKYLRKLAEEAAKDGHTDA